MSKKKRNVQCLKQKYSRTRILIFHSFFLAFFQLHSSRLKWQKKRRKNWTNPINYHINAISAIHSVNPLLLHSFHKFRAHFVFVSPPSLPRVTEHADETRIIPFRFYTKTRQGFVIELIVEEQRAATNIHKDPMSPEAN